MRTTRDARFLGAQLALLYAGWGFVNSNVRKQYRDFFIHVRLPRYILVRHIRNNNATHGDIEKELELNPMSKEMLLYTHLRI